MDEELLQRALATAHELAGLEGQTDRQVSASRGLLTSITNALQQQQQQRRRRQQQQQRQQQAAGLGASGIFEKGSRYSRWRTQSGIVEVRAGNGRQKQRGGPLK